MVRQESDYWLISFSPLYFPNSPLLSMLLVDLDLKFCNSKELLWNLLKFLTNLSIIFMISHIFHSSCWQPSGELFVLLSWSCLWWTPFRSQHSVFWPTVTAEWGFSEGTEWWRDLGLDSVDSRGGFQTLLQAGSVQVEIKSLWLSLSLPLLGKTDFPSDVEYLFVSLYFLPCNV